jgi:hypothetical protein
MDKPQQIESARTEIYACEGRVENALACEVYRHANSVQLLAQLDKLLQSIKAYMLADHRKYFIRKIQDMCCPQ